MMEKHQCALENFEEEFKRLPKYASLKQKFLRHYQMSILMSYHQPLAKVYYRTYTAIRTARAEHANSPSWYIIHPFSPFRQHWEFFMLINLLALLYITPLNVAFCDMWFSYLLMILNVVCLVDMGIQFFTGYTIDHLKTVVLNPHKVVVHYLKSLDFWLELIAALPFVSIAWITCAINDKSVILPYLIFLSLVKICRIKSLLDYIGHVLEYWSIIDHWYMLHIKFLVVLLTTVHWCSCLLIFVYTYDQIFMHDDLSCANWHEVWVALNKRNFTKFEIYHDSLFSATQLLFCVTSASHHVMLEYKEVIVYVFTSLVGYLLSTFALVLFVQLLFRLNNSDIRFESLMNQLSRYMSHKQLPMKMQQRLVDYYEFSLRKCYSREDTIFKILSKRIQLEIDAQVIGMMAKRVTVLKGLPDEVITRLMGKMKLEVFLPNDTIIVSGTEGNCMYFIYTGTVAVYSPTGKEICHLEDGAYFGEISLMAQDRKRIANIVALEISEVYRLDRKHFHQQIRIATPDLYRRLESIAERRRENTLVMEEIHRKQMLETTMRMKQDKYAERYA